MTVPPFGPRIALSAAVVGAAVAVGGVTIATGVTSFTVPYGLATFCLLPMVMGFAIGIRLHGQTVCTRSQTAGVIIVSLLMAALALILVAVEGLVCLVMSAPLAIPLALVGAEIARATVDRHQGPIRLALGLLVLPVGAGVEALVPQESALHEVQSVVEVDASPEDVWAHVIAFPPLPEPTAWWFKAGLAFPRYATIEGEGVGAVRYCVFSTGPFVEPVTVWEPGHRLAFNVESSPDPLRELSPYSNLRPRHLDDFLRPRRGEFRLIALPGGRTRLEGSTWYELDMVPGFYWRFIADTVIHRIHLQVLEHIREQVSLAGPTR